MAGEFDDFRSDADGTTNEIDDLLDGLGLVIADELKQVQQECDSAPAPEAVAPAPVANSKPTPKPSRKASQASESDPLAGLEFEGADRIREFLGKPTGEPLYFDLETIPDYSRLDAFELEPLPTIPPEDGPESLLAPEEFLSQTLKEIESWIERHNPPQDWIDKVISQEQASSKPRKGFFEKLEKRQAELVKIAGAGDARNKKLSTTPVTAKIVCASWAVGRDAPVSFYCGDSVDLERHLLDILWRVIARHKPIIGFGISFFDIPLLLFRSMLLKVPPRRVLDLRKYGNTDIVDLCTLLYPNGNAYGMKETSQSLGMTPLVPGVDGSHVLAMFEAGDVTGIRRYNESDVDLEQRLHRDHMAGYFCV